MTPEWYEAQPKEEATACNLCGGHRFSEHAREDRYGLPVRSVRCDACGLLFLNPRMTREAYHRFYADGVYRELLTQFKGVPHDPDTLERGQRIYAGKVVKLLVPFLKARKARTLVDVGGSTGAVAESVAKALDLEATVIEPSKEEGSRAADKGLRLVRSTLENLEPREAYDVVLLCQTVDHLHDIAGGLRTLRALLADDGVMFLDYAMSEIKVDHVYYLDPETMRDYARRGGFAVLMAQADSDGVHVNWIVRRA